MLLIDFSHDVFHLFVAHLVAPSLGKGLLNLLVGLVSHACEDLPDDLNVDLPSEGGGDLEVDLRHVLPDQDLVVQLGDVSHDFLALAIINMLH